jgi:GT2 family glycosyltransferase
VLDGWASWLTQDVLVLVSESPAAEDTSVQLARDGAQVPLESSAMSLHRSEGDSPAVLRVVLFPEREGQDGGWESLAIGGGPDKVEFTAREIQDAAVDLKTLILNHLAPLEARTRNATTNFMASATAGRAGLAMSASLEQVSAALRERLPEQHNSPDASRGLFMEHILALDDRSFYLKGWVHDEDAEIVRLTAVTPEGARAELAQRLFRYPRPDVVEWSNAFSSQARSADLGMICFVELEAPSLTPGHWIFEMENAEGTAVEFAADPTPGEAAHARAVIMEDCGVGREFDDRLMADHLAPAMSRLQAPIDGTTRIAKVIQHGEPPEAPDISIVVPVYRSIEHLEAQLAEFANDPAIRDTDLIYVLDSPEQADHFQHIAAHLYPIYLIPFRIAILDQNLGFAGANNAGASLARGRLLLLLNSDVLPDKPGWLETMREFYDSRSSIGALGPKLIYEDDSIQHAGMTFYRPPGSSLWQDGHYYRGLHRTFPAANIERPVPAVSGACMMIDRSMYDELGGLSGHYVRGDYEDSDICMRLIDMGRENWYLPRAELYHLEAQSYAPELRMPANRFNAWLHTHLWRERIDELMQREEFRVDPTTNGNLGDRSR